MRENSRTGFISNKQHKIQLKFRKKITTEKFKTIKGFCLQKKKYLKYVSLNETQLLLQ